MESRNRNKGEGSENETGESLVDRRMLVVASLVWCMTKPPQDDCPWDAM